jgi:hypothetical protein
MDTSTITLVLIGGVVSLASTLSGIALSHWLESRRLASQVKRHPAEVVYNKQTEFIDGSMSVLDGLNGYISQIDVWLEEEGSEAKRKAAEAAASNQAVSELHELLQRYYVYLPEDLIQHANELFTECLYLSMTPSPTQVRKSLDLLFAFQNTLRVAAGTEALSRDLLAAFRAPGRSEKRHR